MKSGWKKILLGVAVVVAYVMLAGVDQVRAVAKDRRRLRELGSVAECEAEEARLGEEKRRVLAAWAEMRAEKGAESGVGRGVRTESAVLNETYQRMRSHAGVRILGVFPGGVTEESEVVKLLKAIGGESVRSWSVSVEAPWASMRGMLRDFAEAEGDGAMVVQALSMEPGVGLGKPTCWTLTICH